MLKLVRMGLWRGLTCNYLGPHPLKVWSNFWQEAEDLQVTKLFLTGEFTPAS
jgi:hypothetical protein